MYKVIFSKKSKAFLEKNPGYKSKALDISKQFVKLISGEKENIDVKKMKGEWKGFYRVRSGKIRIMLSIDIDTEVLYVERIGFRGDVFKDRK
jgi:mRNA-degrading endonuclease RelE of RelBE toxin-antitoxin system